MQTKFILDSGDIKEYKEIASLADEQGSQLWGSTTNPTLIAKAAGEQLEGKKLTMDEAFEMQRKIVTEILTIVPGAVSAEVYADRDTSADDMARQGREIARWDSRVVVKLPTTVEGFKARTLLRQESILTNNTLVFSPEQIYAICLHEEIIQREYEPQSKWPPFISPFVGRIDDKDFEGMDLVQQGMKIKGMFNAATWMLEASVRTIADLKRGIELKSELITAPAAVFKEYFALGEEERETKVYIPEEELRNDLPEWKPPVEFLTTSSMDDFYRLIESGTLNVNHPLTDAGIDRFVSDWKAILQ